MTPCEATTFVVVGMKVITPPKSVEVNYALIYASFPSRNFTAWCLIKHTDKLAFTYAVIEF